MSQQFNSIKVGTTARSTFDLSHHQVTTSDFGYLIPVCVRDMIPNDDFTVSPSIMCRMAPAAFPFYGKVTCRLHSFFVPYRLLFPDWTLFLTQSSASNKIPPYFTVSAARDLLDLDPQFGQSGHGDQPRGLYGRIMANLGINPNLLTNSSDGLPGTERISAFRSLAYYRIWLDWFMDSNIYDHGQMVSNFNYWIKDGGQLHSSFLATILRYRCACFGKDYFTTAKLHPQAGSTPSTLPVDIAGTDLNPGLDPPSSGSSQLYFKSDGSVQRAGGGNPSSSVIGQFTVEDLRAAVSLQRYLERNNYVGSKVINQLLVHFGIAPTPERLDMSEFIGGSNLPLVVGDVTSHSPSYFGSELDTVGLGAQAGKGIIKGSSKTISYHAKEHGVFMTLLSIIPDSGYYQGISKIFQLGTTGDPLDFYTPEFENLGYQEILNKEVYIPEPGDQYPGYDPDGIFGYAPRYAFMKWQSDILAGDFVGNLAGQDSPVMGANMDAWHLFRHFVYDNVDPIALNSNFVECDNHNNNFDRVFQVTNNQLDHFYFSIDMDVKATRPMVGFAEPSLDSVSSGDGNKINLPYGGTRL